MPYRVTVWLERDDEKWEETANYTIDHTDDENYIDELLLEALEDVLFEICPEDSEELLQQVLRGDKVVGWLPPDSPEDACPVCDVRCIICYPSVPEGAELVTVNWLIEEGN